MHPSNGNADLAARTGWVQPETAPGTNVVVYLEDNEDDSYLLRHALKTAGVPCRLEVINAPRAARDFLAEFAPKAPNLIVCDLGLAGTCGLDLLEWIRCQPHLSTVPIILVTGALSVGQRERARLIGVNACVEKSVDSRELTSHIRRFLEHST